MFNTVPDTQGNPIFSSYSTRSANFNENMDEFVKAPNDLYIEEQQKKKPVEEKRNINNEALNAIPDMPDFLREEYDEAYKLPEWLEKLNVTTPEEIEEWKNMGAMGIAEAWEKNNKWRAFVPYANTTADAAEAITASVLLNRAKKGEELTEKQTEILVDYCPKFFFRKKYLINDFSLHLVIQKRVKLQVSVGYRYIDNPFQTSQMLDGRVLPLVVVFAQECIEVRDKGIVQFLQCHIISSVLFGDIFLYKYQCALIMVVGIIRYVRPYGFRQAFQIFLIELAQCLVLYRIYLVQIRIFQQIGCKDIAPVEQFGFLVVYPVPYLSEGFVD